MNTLETNHVIVGNTTLDMYDDVKNVHDLDAITSISEFEQAFSDRRYFLGGPGANVAYRLFQLADNIGVFTITGTKVDPFARGARDAYTRMNLTCAHLSSTTQRMARCAYFLGSDRKPIYVDNASSEFPNLNIGECFGQGLSFAHVLYLPATENTTAVRAIKKFRKRSLPQKIVSYCPGPRITREFEPEEFLRIMKGVSFLFLNQEEAEIVQTEIHSLDILLGNLPHLKLAVVTRDKEGSTIYQRYEEPIKFDLTEDMIAENPVDSSGAGDAFFTTLTFELSSDQNFPLKPAYLRNKVGAAHLAAKEVLMKVGATNVEFDQNGNILSGLDEIVTTEDETTFDFASEE
tara:strand:- start:3015 stop:4055 length:1041 start_codon:yes stop_codon:yes gene_type:complete